MTNALRIPFAEWLYRMYEGAVPYQARSLAIYAVAFKITSNEELACLVGMDTKGVADKTYNKWKRYLSDNGWVIVKQITVGRQTTVEIHPAYHETPVTFTDLTSKQARKFYEAPKVTITDVSAVEITAEPEKVTDETASSKENSPHTPLKEIKQIQQTTTTTVETDAASGGGGNYLDSLNGTAIDLVAFIGKHAYVEQDDARRMLATNIKTFGAEPMMEAYSVTIADMAGGLIGKPYKYLIECARKIRDGRKRRQGSADPTEGFEDKMRRVAAEMDKKEGPRWTR